MIYIKFITNVYILVFIYGFSFSSYIGIYRERYLSQQTAGPPAALPVGSMARKLLDCHLILLKICNTSQTCVSSLRRGHANLLCIVPILIYVLP